MPFRGYRKGSSDTKIAVPRYVRTRLSEDDFALLKLESDQRGVTISTLVRLIITAHLKNVRLEAPQKRGVSDEALRQLARIGNNLNQLVKLANQKITPVRASDTEACIAAINELARRL